MPAKENLIRINVKKEFTYEGKDFLFSFLIPKIPGGRGLKSTCNDSSTVFHAIIESLNVARFLSARERKPCASSDRFPCPWTLKAYVSKEILKWHCHSLCLIADLCINFY